MKKTSKREGFLISRAMSKEFYQYGIYVIAFLFLLVTLEIVWSWRYEKHKYNVKETAANLFIFAGFQLSKYLFTGYQLAVFAFFYQFRLFTFPKSIWLFLLAVVVVDFLYYCFHRISHTVKFFWAFHLVHHSSPWLNLTTAYRINWFGALIMPLFYIPAILIGFTPVTVVLAYSLNLLYQFFLHTEAIGKLGFLEKIIDTPSNHRVHHGANPQYIDKNFGGILMIWDRLFGTYEPENEKVKYGITTGFMGHNPFKLVFHGFIDLFKGKMNYKG